ncbi:MAG: transposase [Bacteroidales bacterium]|nr:transposase [Bacteroidales bacterium]
MIANIYRNRWQIETFFKWIKGNLTIKALWGYSGNAVKIHLWVAISTCLLLAWGESRTQKSADDYRDL